MVAEVFFHSLEQAPGHEFAPADPRAGLRVLVERLGLAGAANRTSPWGLKVHLGAPGLPPAVDPGWALAAAEVLAGSGTSLGESFCFDTLSITTGGLDTVAKHLELAGIKGFGGHELPYLVADDPGQGTSCPLALAEDPATEGLALAAAVVKMAGILVLNPVRPHPHAGLQGALFNLGLGLVDRESKILLHKDIRPNVDTPLCAGCGSCLAVCLFDAIAINGGRAFIDHTKCTGCGECMNVCFMAGISADEAAGIPRFQGKVAGAAAAARRRVGLGLDRREGYVNLLVRLDRHGGGGRPRGRQRLGDLGILASTDPVALDQATWDLICDRTGGSLSSWSGFGQEPEVLISQAERSGLGAREYRLVDA